MHLSLLAYVWYYFWIAPHVLLSLIAVLLFRRGLHRQFPAFFGYCVWESIFFVILFASAHISHSSSTYQLFLRTSMAGSICLRFGILYEIFATLLRPYPSISTLSKSLFRWAAAVLILIGVAVAAYQHGLNESPATAAVTAIDRSVSFVQCGLLIFLLFFSSYFRLSWKNFAVGLALGLGVFASVDLASITVMSELAAVPRRLQYVFDFVNMGSYHCSVLIWLGYLLAPERVQKVATPVPSHDLESWDRELERLLQR
jgi:hypothetical protein